MSGPVLQARAGPLAEMTQIPHVERVHQVINTVCGRPTADTFLGDLKLPSLITEDKRLVTS